MQPNDFEEELPEGLATVHLVFMAGIHPESVRSLMTTLSVCANQGVEEVRLLLGTGGGGMDFGVGLYNALRGMPFNLVTHNIGTVASIGVPIFVAGDERIACQHSSFMLHGATNEVPAGQAFGAKWFREQHDSLLAGEARTNAILAERTKLSDKELSKRSETEQTIDAKAAVKLGIAHKIEDVDIPQDGFVYTIPV